ncbi:hypothetical protein RRG08_066511 [Elysia crispata]|uniref:Uncharacterized protein n=1 Tax=Elysia crispata TaxID=231223 RepID=A0AAE1DIF5_9GAST|nr:hypothetical protein RRG08_066511 [Elysia crispata]
MQLRKLGFRVRTTKTAHVLTICFLAHLSSHPNASRLACAATNRCCGCGWSWSSYRVHAKRRALIGYTASSAVISPHQHT